MSKKTALLTLAGLTTFVWMGATAPALAYCVENQDPERVFFVVEPANGSGERQTFWLNSGEKFCGKPDRGGEKIYIRVFANEEDLEGCSRIGMATKTVRLDELGLYDRCAWSQM